jgi:hypothetical protein
MALNVAGQPIVITADNTETHGRERTDTDIATFLIESRVNYSELARKQCVRPRFMQNKSYSQRTRLHEGTSGLIEYILHISYCCCLFDIVSRDNIISMQS